MNKKNTILLILACLLFVAGYITKSTTHVPEIDSAQAAKLERKENRQKRKESPPKPNDSRKEKRNKKKENKKENKSKNKSEKSNLTDEEKLTQKKERRDKKTDKNLSNKTWWNKKGGSKYEDIKLSDEVKALMDAELVDLLQKRKELGQKLSKLTAANSQALAAGDLNAIEQNLASIQAIENLWGQERQAAILNIVRELTSEQMLSLSQAAGDVSSLNWLDFNLTKGMDSKSKKPKKEKNRRNKPNPES